MNLHILFIIFIFIICARPAVLLNAKTIFNQVHSTADASRASETMNERKIYFTANSQQCVKFNVDISYLLDFAMCVWYKPTVILQQNILFSYSNADEQLILWKIKGKHMQPPTLVLKILGTVITEQKVDGLTTGQWHHLCHYWKGSTGLWALFLNNYILSYGYKDKSPRGIWLINTLNATASINELNSKKPLHGEVYGFYLMSLSTLPNFKEHLPHSNAIRPRQHSLALVHKSNYSGTSILVNKVLSSRKKRQLPPSSTTPSPTIPPQPQQPFFRIRNFLRFVRRLVQMVTIPVIRFAQALVKPWTRKLMSARPVPPPTTVPPTTTPVATEPSTATRTTTPKPRLIETEMKSMFSQNNLDELEAQITIYESELEFQEPRQLRNIRNSTNPTVKLIVNSSNLVIQQQLTEAAKIQFPPYEGDKCHGMEEKFTNLKVSQIMNFVMASTESQLDDAITHLGVYLQFMHILYSCCIALHKQVLISWARTAVTLKNVVVEPTAGCANF